MHTGRQSRSLRIRARKPRFRLGCLLAGALSLALAAGPAAAQALSKSARAKLTQTLAAADADRWTDAAALAKQTSDPVFAKLIDWMRLGAAKSGASFDEVDAFLAANPDWPGADKLQRRAEEAIGPAMADERILAWFAARPPVSPDGAFQLARVLEAKGRVDEAAALVQRTWRELELGDGQADDFRRRFHNYIRPEDDIARLERLLWQRKTTAVRRQLRYVPQDWHKLAEARIALMSRAPRANTLAADVPAALRDNSGLLFEQVRWHRRAQRIPEAIGLLLGVAKPAATWEPERWWREREYLVRWALNENDAALAYKLAAAHFQVEGSEFAEAEWLAGWIALRKLARPDDALRHFQAMYDKVNYPISRSRGAYWLARANELKEQHNTATRWYREAAVHVTHFYGQLAAGHLLEAERPPLPKEPEPSEQDAAAFGARELARAVRLMADADRRREVRSFLLALAAASKTPTDWTLATRLAQDIGRYDLAVSVAKLALREGVVLSTSGYPALEPANASSRDFPDPAILHAVVRQESAFDTEAVSHAGARGLMQLMPQTALRVARRLNMSYSRNRLTHDPTYNLRLGQAYLADMLYEYDGSLILALAAYNAGPVRVERWLQNYGDPGPSIYDAIDWAESIPFTETRNYVQRVLENLAVYRSREQGVQLALTYPSIEPGPFKDSAGRISRAGSLPLPTDADEGEDFAGP